MMKMMMGVIWEFYGGKLREPRGWLYSFLHSP